MSVFIVNNNRVNVSEDGSINIQNKLEAGTYYVEFDVESHSFYLNKTTNFKVPSKLYGETEPLTQRIIRTYTERTSNTGVLLSGVKGSGKTLLATHISLNMIAQGVPTIIVNQMFQATGLAMFLKKIDDSCVVIFDEFEKLFNDTNDEEYAGDPQNGLLSLFDGVLQGKKLFILTCNNRWLINKNLINRPGRIFYHIHYNGVDEKTIIEYCNICLINKDFIKEIINVKNICGNEFSFDVLKALVEECNRYNELPITLLNYMNIEPDSDFRCSYTAELVDENNVKMIVRGEDGDFDNIYNINLLSKLHMYYYQNEEKQKEGRRQSLNLTPHDIQNKSENTIVYQKNGFTATFTKMPDQFEQWKNLLNDY